ncbi:MAG TPA: O-antigen ligase family protein [Rhodothermales bacterium]|nr:O-antigen ligase family protein [Rhodothermales bacterium]
MLIPALATVLILAAQVAGLWYPLISPEEFSKLPRVDKVLLSRSALLGNRDDVGVYLLIPLSVSLGLVHRKPLMMAVLTGSLVGGIVLSTTLTAIAVMGALLAGSGLWWMRKAPRGTLVIASSLTLLLLITSVALLPEEVQRKITWYGNHLSEGRMGELLGGRLEPFRASAHLIRNHPFLGVGPGRFPLEYIEVARDLAARDQTLQAGAEREEAYFDMVHNDYLETAAEAGVPLLLGMVIFVTVFVRATLINVSSRLPLSVRAVGAGVAAAALAICAAAMVQFPLQIAVVYGSLAIAAGIGVGHVEHHED